ncbi:hypothetical protein P170DRAFT_125441 [Aspergillus steynii IBT 23096]|uniref:Uncharacterized protein n=1 Tax=Aspergillus steynii IBT 23096 TaxID=1392250 RepID=A0A2I2GK14_9EURO|nr:uncharacterized protein P170DRAFT_125441 [Aspergillus steynii IBT 23096]PLB53212.1 hypothetical protein P170DRAFT_125441 [Aspergillus steynii IBT 23096]
MMLNNGPYRILNYIMSLSEKCTKPLPATCPEPIRSDLYTLQEKRNAWVLQVKQTPPCHLPKDIFLTPSPGSNRCFISRHRIGRVRASWVCTGFLNDLPSTVPDSADINCRSNRDACATKGHDFDSETVPYYLVDSWIQPHFPHLPATLSEIRSQSEPRKSVLECYRYLSLN